MKKTTDEASLSSPSQSDRVESKRNVLFVCDEWNSSKGGLSTFNREFAINLAKTSRKDFAIHCYVCQSSESDREDTRNNGMNIITAKSIPGTSDRLEWLRLPPSELAHLDVVIEWKWFRPLANSPPTSSPRSNRVRLLCDEFAPLYILHYFASLFNRVRPQYI